VFLQEEKTDDVAQNGLSVISYDQWKVNKFRLLSDGICAARDVTD